MKSIIFTALCTLLTFTAAKISLQDVKHVTTGTATIIPGRYIVEFDSSAHLSAGISKRAASAHEAVYNDLKARKVKFNVHFEYSSELFTGASMTLSTTDDLSSLAGVTGVVNISPVHLLSLPDSIDSQSLDWGSRPESQSANLAVQNTTTVPGNSTTYAQPSVTTVCTTKNNKQTCTTSTIAAAATSSAAAAKSTTGFSNLPQIQADRVHATGNKGKGVKVAIIDGGVDYTRPALGGCFGSGCKIAGGYDFVGDSYTGSNDPVPDNDPLDVCYTHGSTTAGIIIAGDNEYNMTGVAPEASLYVYRVFGCNGATSDDIVIQALARAYADDMDVINLSLGEITGWTEGALNVVASRLVAKGTIVTASAGNQGQVGAFYASSPASGLGVINVGSTDNAIFPAQLATVSTGYGPIVLYNYQPFTMSGTQPVPAKTPYQLVAYTTNPNVAADGCTFPNGGVDLANKFLIVRAGGCTVSIKAQYAYRSGAKGIIVVNTDGAAPSYQNFPLINYAMISKTDGDYLLGQIAANTTVSLSFDFSPVVIPNTFTGNTTSYFSEIGPTNDLFLAPSVTAPGQGIVAVIPYNPSRYFYNWTITDGTSWSSAFAAGSAALYLNAKGVNSVSPLKVKEALEFTSTALPVSRSDSSLLTVAAQGAGKIQVFDAINSGLVVSPAEILLNDTAYFNSIQYITLKNTGKSTVKYSLKNVPAGTAFTIGTNQQPNDQPLPQGGNTANVWFSQSSLTLWPGFSTVVLMKFTAPTGLDASQFPVYSGYIQITGGNNPVQIPYLGVAAKMKDMRIIDPTDFDFDYVTPVILDGDSNVQSGTKSYTFADDDYPTVVYRTNAGTPILVIDLVNANATLGFTPNYNTKRSIASSPEEVARQLENLKRSVALSPRRAQSSGSSASTGGGLLRWWCQITKNKGFGCNPNTTNTFNKVPVVGNLFEADYIPRNTDNADGKGNEDASFALDEATFSNGTVIPNGTYRFLMRALKITGDSTKQADYESWLSMPFVVAQ